MADIAKEIESKDAGATASADVSFDGVLAPGDTLTGTPTCASSPSGLSFASVALNASAVTINGVSVDANRAVQFLVSGGTAGTLYKITVTCSSTNGEVDRQREVWMEVT